MFSGVCAGCSDTWKRWQYTAFSWFFVNPKTNIYNKFGSMFRFLFSFCYILFFRLSFDFVFKFSMFGFRVFVLDALTHEKNWQYNAFLWFLQIQRRMFTTSSIRCSVFCFRFAVFCFLFVWFPISFLSFRCLVFGCLCWMLWHLKTMTVQHF